MAGESPDKSEQQKSSGETTPSERDPRLAVFRSAGEPAEGRVEGRVDQPTAVFRTLTAPEPADEADEDADAPVGADADAGVDADVDVDADVVDADADVDAPEPGEDARLRAAVAAWVSRPDGAEKAEEASVEASTDGSEDESDDPEDTVEDEADASGDEPEAEQAADSGEDDEDNSAKAKVPSWAAVKKEAAEPAADESDESDDDVADVADVADEPEADDADDAPDADESAADKAADEPPVDQPTAVFKALPRPAVDQPTTTLKATATAEKPKTESKPAATAEKPKSESKPAATAEKPKSESKPAPEPKAAPEPPKPAPKPAPAPAPERAASQFVPLRRDDVAPAAPAASAASAAPASLAEAERTKQQPLPPLPPLDLLAELTNTPPPPQTPVRTAIRRVKIWTPLVVLLLIVFAVVQMVRPLPDPALELTAATEYSFKGGAVDLPWPAEGQAAVEVEGVGSLGTFGEQKPAPIASVAKTMTAYVILKNHPLKGKETGPQIEVDQRAEEESNAEDESTAPIRAGQKFSLKQMLQLLMIPSGNNAARLLARWDSKSEAEFVKQMNDAAKELGMNDTTYTDPSGLKATSVSTATDQLKLAKAVMQNDVFREIVDTPDIQIPGIDTKIYNNNNLLLNDGVKGIKTGSSTPAGGNLLWAADTIVDGKERRIYGAVFGIQRGDSPDSKLQSSLKDSLPLIKAAQKAVTSEIVVKKGDVVGYVDDGLGGRVEVVATKDVKAIGWPGVKAQLKLGAGKATLPREAKAGTVVGELSVGTGTGKASAPVALKSDLTEPGFGEKLTRIL
ncbi:serine hydrolase [Streptomyces sp. NPDC000410]|uniref:serine hydrolase n=1 Tax=Streptomyces sp. NPDC000410 TaxID=3154254 RepID=UPI003319352F